MNNSIVYIPLDDRPVCFKRVKLLAEASGLNVIVPDVELIKTCLDDQKPNSTGLMHGDPKQLLTWFKGLNHEAIAYYIISIDQIISGGLVNSRHDYHGNLDEAYDIIDKYLDESLLNKKKVILIDSVVRLAVTCGYDHSSLDFYEATRTFGGIGRKATNDISDINEVFNNYLYDEKGKAIDPEKYGLSKEETSHYLDNRKRKLLLSTYLINKIKKLRKKGLDIYYMLGIDDSIPHSTIQTNEIKYFKKLIDNEMGLVFIGIDELPVMAVSKMTKKIYNQRNVQAKIYYMGENYKVAGDAFDVGTIEENVNNHLQVLEVDKTSNNPDIHVIMLTYKEDEGPNQEKNVNNTINLINELLAKNQFVILMDLTNSLRYGPLQKQLMKRVTYSELLAYSNWNTIANSVGLSLSQGLSRYYYLNYCGKSSVEANLAYVELSAFSFIKDITYKVFACKVIGKYINTKADNVRASLNFYRYLNLLGDLEQDTARLMNDDKNPAKYENIINELKENNIISGFVNGSIIYDKNYEIVINRFFYPWYRSFELDMNIEVRKK